MEILTSAAPPKPLFVPPLETAAACVLSQDGSQGLAFTLCLFFFFSVAAYRVKILIFFLTFLFARSLGGEKALSYACLPLCTHKMCVFR